MNIKDNKKKLGFLLIFLILVVLGVNYNYLNKGLERVFVNYEKGIVERVIDGDTVKINNESVRLLGINCPEKGEKYYSEAKNFTTNELLGKEVKIYFGKDKYDLYERKLGYIFVGGENVNAKIVENGFANYYFPSGKDQYYASFYSAWENCLNNKINLCKMSENSCAKCVKLKDLSVENQEAIFENICGSDCNLKNWDIKDEGRKHFTFSDFNLRAGKSVIVKVGNSTNSNEILYWTGETYVWTKSGDTLFLRDLEGGLVLWEGY